MAEDELEGVEICNLGGVETALPLELINQLDVFKEVLSIYTWKNVLTKDDRKYLEKFLPTLPTDYPHAQEENVSALFGGENFRFGNPVIDFHSKLKDGYFYPDVVKYKKLCQKAKYKEYKLQQQQYYRKLLQEVMISRQEILDQVSRQGPSDPIRTRGKVVSNRGSLVEQRVQQRMKKIISECRQESEDAAVSSEDEERLLSNGSGPFSGMGYPVPGYPVPGLFVSSGFHPMVPPIPGMPYGFPSFPYSSPIPYRPTSTSLNHVTEEDFQKMLQKHRKRRINNEELPELDTRFTSLQDVALRTNPTKRASKAATVISKAKARPTLQGEISKKKDKKAKLKKKLKQKLKQKQDRQSKKQESKEATAAEPVTSNLPPAPTGKFSCFFSLLREVLYALPDLKATLQKIEEQVRSWQASPSFTASSWSAQEGDWVKLVYSSLVYLSGSSGVTSSTFVPLVDFKERPQQWKWIGAFRDSDEELVMLCQDWMQVKDQLSIKKTTAEGGSSVNAPEARVKTNYVVRPSTNNERDDFRAQEAERYQNPHKAFTFNMHGFESIVGPVKGVFSKETNLNKAREHSLLISNRPPFVTILTLVRDAAARLPNGEGTRAEVCELLKDSQFLNPNATDAQIHTVVSGALDRLHYEKDPCVKYDSNRKVWIYLHRNRTEEEFEKIHQANAAAARAKKLQKPRVPRHSKQKEDESSPVTSHTVASVVESVDPNAAMAVATLAPDPTSETKLTDVKKPAIKLKIAGNFNPLSTGHPKVSVITSVGHEKKIAEQTAQASQGPRMSPKGTRIMATIQGGTVIMSPPLKTGKTKLRTSEATTKKASWDVSSSGPSKIKYSSALNAQSAASPLNTAGFDSLPTHMSTASEPAVKAGTASGSESEAAVKAGTASGSESEAAVKAGTASGSESEASSFSENESESSSEGEGGWGEQHSGGKIAFGQDVGHLSQYSYTGPVQERKSVISHQYGYVSLAEPGAIEGRCHEDDPEGYASSEDESGGGYSNEDE